MKFIVVKVGSALVVRPDGTVNDARCAALCRALRIVQERGYAPLLVLSGAVALGRHRKGVTEIQAQAACGQLQLMTALSAAAAPAHLPLALLLVTRQDVVHRERYRTLQTTLAELCGAGIVPVLNENDAVTASGTNDFPDNDHLAAILAVSIGAERLCLLTNTEGILSGNPRKERMVHLVKTIENVNTPLLAIARGEHSVVGRGGAVGKLKAARLATAVGIPVHIFDGRHPKYLVDILGGRARGTFCKPRRKEQMALSNRERWLLSAQNTGSSVQIDAGAVAALSHRKSLLAVGVKKLFGAFAPREVVEVVDEKKETVAIGLTEIASDALVPLLGSRNKAHGVEVIHANNLILL